MKKLEFENLIISVIEAIEDGNLDFAYRQIVKYKDTFVEGRDPEDCDIITQTQYEIVYGLFSELAHCIIDGSLKEVNELKDEIIEVLASESAELIEEKMTKEYEEIMADFINNDN